MKETEQAGEVSTPASERATPGDGEFDQLKSSYKNLRADYTRKCQRLAELERCQTENLRNTETSLRTPEELLKDEDFIEKYVLRDKRIVERVIAEYGKSAPFLMPAVPGGAPAGEAVRPKSLAEAGELARKTIVIR